MTENNDIQPIARSTPNRLFGQFIIKDGFQFKFTILVMISMSICVFAMWYFAHASIVNIVENESMGPDAKDRLLLITKIILRFGVIGIAATVFLMLKFTHRIAGPIYRFEKTFEEIKNGNLAIFVRLRPKDQFHDSAELFNQAIVSLRNKIQKDRDVTSGSLEKVKAIADQLTANGQTKEAGALNQILSDLKNTTPNVKL